MENRLAEIKKAEELRDKLLSDIMSDKMHKKEKQIVKDRFKDISIENKLREQLQNRNS